MINAIAIILIVFSVGQILLGIATLTGKFEPLLPKERKKLPAKVRRKRVASMVFLCSLPA